MSQKVCCLGVCKGMTWDEAKEFIINKHDVTFWGSWIDRVSWREVTEIEEKLMEDINELKLENKKNKKLAEQVRYWKNSALFYWSGHQLGKEANSDSDVWLEALEQVEDTSNECDVEELTKKCMDD